MRPNIEQHTSSRSIDDYQRIYNDNILREIVFHAWFEYNGNFLSKGHFLMRNRKKGKRKYNLDAITYCKDLKLIKAHVSIVTDGSHKGICRKNDLDFAGLNWPVDSSINFRIYFTTEVIQNPIINGQDCKNIKPDDKDGSILIGTQ